MQQLIEQLRGGGDLAPDQVRRAVEILVADVASDADKADFLRALRAKGETADEIAGFVNALLERAVDPGIDTASRSAPVIDVCGTGGDRLDLFNISTTSMFIVAAAGAVVVKHGNRGISSKSGGADVLEHLGVRIDLGPDALKRCVETVGIGFLFAPNYHPAFKAIAPIRKRLAAEGTATIFNILGPLLNPVRPSRQLIGLFSEALLPVYARALTVLGRTHAWVVCGASSEGYGMDELSTLGPTLVRQITGDALNEFTLVPEQFGLQRALLPDLRGGDKAENAEIVLGILSGTLQGPKRDIVLLNAAAALVIAGLSDSIDNGLGLAAEQIDSGRALARLRALQEFVP